MTTDLLQSLLRKGYIDSTRLQEARTGRDGTRQHSLPLMLDDLLLGICSLGSRCDNRHEGGKLLAKSLNAGVINPKEEEGFGLFGKTRPVEKY
jgi:hypothetical protein